MLPRLKAPRTSPSRKNQYQRLPRRNAARSRASAALQLLLLVSLLFLSTQPLVADDLQKAETLEKSGHPAEAIGLYQKWLRSSPASAAWDKTLLHTAELMTDPSEAVATLLGGLPKLTTETARHEVYVRVGRLDELLGDWTGAQESFQNASLVPGPKDFESLLQSARILLQLGELPKASAQVRSIVTICQDPAIVAAAQVVLVRLDAISGRASEAETQITKLLVGLVELSPQSLAELYDAAARLGLSKQQALIRTALKTRYPQSPESSVVDGKTPAFPSPARLLGFSQSPYGDATAPPAGSTALGSTGSEATASINETAAVTPANGKHQSVDVQIGSYRDHTNAEYRLQDLENAGFTGKILKANIGGSTYYKVVIPNVLLSRSQEVLTKLKVKGFEGFLLYD